MNPSILLPAIVIFLCTFGHASMAVDKSQSHWCPTIEVRRVSCVKNVSLGGEPATLRRVYQWKKELVLRCCPGFMGPNCEKACFSCKQWAEMVGKVHHLEQYLQQGRSISGISNRFEPFTPDQTANTVCWTKDGRPVYANFSPPDYGTGGEQMPGRRGGFDSAEGDKEVERSRIYVRKGASAAYRQGNGCPIYSSRRNDGSNERKGSPYHYMQQTRQERPRRQQQRASISVDARSRRQESLPGMKSHNPMPAKSAHYQKHPPLPNDRKPIASYAKAGEMSRSSRTSPPMKQIIRRRSDVSDDDIADIRRRYTKTRSATNDNLAYDNRLSILERQMVELERKLSAISPALTSVASMKDEISLLTKQLEILKTRLDTTGNLQQTSGQDTSSVTTVNIIDWKQNAESGATNGPQQLIRSETGAHVQESKHNGSSGDCMTQCKDNPAPPLPDKDVVQALFPNDPEVAEALEKGSEEFYREVKKAIKGKRNPEQRLDGSHFNSQRYRSDEHSETNKAFQMSKLTKDNYEQRGTQARGSRLEHQQAHGSKSNRQEARLSSETRKENQSSRANFLGVEGLTLYFMYCLSQLCP